MDRFIQEMGDGQTVRIPLPFDNEETQDAARRLIALKLATSNRENVMSLTDTGIQAYEARGYEQWYLSKLEDRQLDNDAKSSSIEANQLNIWQLKNSYKFIAINILLALLTAMLTAYLSR